MFDEGSRAAERQGLFLDDDEAIEPAFEDRLADDAPLDDDEADLDLGVSEDLGVTEHATISRYPDDADPVGAAPFEVTVSPHSNR